MDGTTTDIGIVHTLETLCKLDHLTNNQLRLAHIDSVRPTFDEHSLDLPSCRCCSLMHRLLHRDGDDKIASRDDLHARYIFPRLVRCLAAVAIRAVLRHGVEIPGDEVLRLL